MRLHEYLSNLFFRQHIQDLNFEKAKTFTHFLPSSYDDVNKQITTNPPHLIIGGFRTSSKDATFCRDFSFRQNAREHPNVPNIHSSSTTFYSGRYLILYVQKNRLTCSVIHKCLQPPYPYHLLKRISFDFFQQNVSQWRRRVGFGFLFYVPLKVYFVHEDSWFDIVHTQKYGFLRLSKSEKPQEKKYDK